MKTVEMIVPCYNEEECIALFYARVCEVFENLKEHRFYYYIYRRWQQGRDA